jgi:hypothetical protein
MSSIYFLLRSLSPVDASYAVSFLWFQLILRPNLFSFFQVVNLCQFLLTGRVYAVEVSRMSNFILPSVYVPNCLFRSYEFLRPHGDEYEYRCLLWCEDMQHIRIYQKKPCSMIEYTKMRETCSFCHQGLDGRSNKQVSLKHGSTFTWLLGVTWLKSAVFPSFYSDWRLCVFLNSSIHSACPVSLNTLACLHR